MSDIFEEVDEAVQQDKLTSFWNRISIFVYIGIAAIIIGVAVMEFLKWQSANELSKKADDFYLARQALETNNYVEAEAIFSVLAEDDDHFADLAAHYLAETRIVGFGDKTKAIEGLKTAAGGEGPFAVTARLKAGYLMSDETSFDELSAWLMPLTADIESPFSFMAEEILASKAYSDGDIETAKQKFSSIALGFEVPAGVRARAQKAEAVIESLQSKDGNL